MGLIYQSFVLVDEIHMVEVIIFIGTVFVNSNITIPEGLYFKVVVFNKLLLLYEQISRKVKVKSEDIARSVFIFELNLKRNTYFGFSIFT